MLFLFEIFLRFGRWFQEKDDVELRANLLFFICFISHKVHDSHVNFHSTIYAVHALLFTRLNYIHSFITETQVFFPLNFSKWMEMILSTFSFHFMHIKYPYTYSKHFNQLWNVHNEYHFKQDLLCIHLNDIIVFKHISNLLRFNTANLCVWAYYVLNSTSCVLMCLCSKCWTKYHANPPELNKDILVVAAFIAVLWMNWMGDEKKLHRFWMVKCDILPDNAYDFSLESLTIRQRNCCRVSILNNTAREALKNNNFSIYSCCWFQFYRLLPTLLPFCVYFQKVYELYFDVCCTDFVPHASAVHNLSGYSPSCPLTLVLTQ